MQATKIAYLNEYTLKIFYNILIFLSILLPTSTLLGFNIKIATSIFVIILFSLFVITTEKKLNLPSISIYFFSVLFLLIWSFVDFFKTSGAFEYTFDAFKNFNSVFLILFLSYYLCKSEIITFYSFVRVLVCGNFLFSLLKVMITLFLYLEIFTIYDIQSILSPLFGDIFYGQPIYQGTTRFHFPNDSITPFLLFFVFMMGKSKLNYSTAFMVAYSVISYLSLFIAFSRFLIMSVILISIMCGVLKKKLSLLLIVLLASCAVLITEPAKEIYELRFLSGETNYGDSLKVEQAKFLLDEASENMIIGKGLGSYSPKIIRDDKLRYSYEVQWLSFAMQFGMLGLSILLIFSSLPILKILSYPVKKINMGILLTYLMWLLSGFTNPYLLSSMGGCIFSLFMLASINSNKLKNYEKVPTVGKTVLRRDGVYP